MAWHFIPKDGYLQRNFTVIPNLALTHRSLWWFVKQYQQKVFPFISLFFLILYILLVKGYLISESPFHFLHACFYAFPGSYVHTPFVLEELRRNPPASVDGQGDWGCSENLKVGILKLDLLCKHSTWKILTRHR